MRSDEIGAELSGATPVACARSIAESFAGADGGNEMSHKNVAEVVYELASMVCGSTLSHLAIDRNFDFEAPRFRGRGAFRVLIVDDSRSMRNVIRRIMTISGLDVEAVFEAADGLEALEVVNREWVDVILTDINMPRMNGEELIGRLADAGITQSVAVIVVSTDATAVRKDSVAALGARGYLVKPFLPEALKDEIERVMGATDAK